MLTTESKRTTASRPIPFFGVDGSADLRVPSLEMTSTPLDTIDTASSAAELPIETGDSDTMTMAPTFFTLQFDRRPLDGSADYALKLVMRSLNIVYSKQVIDRIGMQASGAHMCVCVRVCCIVLLRVHVGCLLIDINVHALLCRGISVNPHIMHTYTPYR